MRAVTLKIFKTSEVEGNTSNNQQRRLSEARDLGVDNTSMPAATHEIYLFDKVDEKFTYLAYSLKLSALNESRSDRLLLNTGS
ncbi:hypothetical protein [Pseudoalteromonas sp.]|uniref:hypothetical protein n=1 Tax=Gammaproteobacteria TaxID=1236 RepID=UPI003F9451BF